MTTSVCQILKRHHLKVANQVAGMGSQGSTEDCLTTPLQQDQLCEALKDVNGGLVNCAHCTNSSLTSVKITDGWFHGVKVP